ncbi:MAG: amino acid ABC transporter ATP-binding protein [Clostridiales bacterium]|nr:amino acid ABC transporter ATP-binding protein [Clostridiales bacterium]
MLEVKNISKSFGKLRVLKNIDLTVNEGEVVAIIGPSGSGKTTLLRCLNFLERADEGVLTIDGLSADLKKTTAKQRLALRRKTAMVFQNYALFLNKTARENVTEGLIVSKKMKKAEARTLAEEYLKKVGLTDKYDAKPFELSGGQQQRVGIARALALNPKVILFDEPTSALDPEKVNEILDVICVVASGATAIIVTHEMQFAYDVATRVIFMDEGEIVEDGTPKEVFDNPKTERTAQFLSRFNINRNIEYII